MVSISKVKETTSLFYNNNFERLGKDDIVDL